jgi:acyl-coenzyme A thioesterase PaaI-like protein
MDTPMKTTELAMSNDEPCPVMRPEWQMIRFGTDCYGSRMPEVEARLTAAGTAEVRVPTGPSVANQVGVIHGGFLAGLGEQIIHLPPHLEGTAELSTMVTVDYAVQYLAPGDIDQPITVFIETLRATGRMFFMRATFAQSHGTIMHCTATLRRVRPR